MKKNTECSYPRIPFSRKALFGFKRLKSTSNVNETAETVKLSSSAGCSGPSLSPRNPPYWCLLQQANPPIPVHQSAAWLLWPLTRLASLTTSTAGVSAPLHLHVSCRRHPNSAGGPLPLQQDNENSTKTNPPGSSPLKGVYTIFENCFEK